MRVKDDTINLVDLHPKLASILSRIDRWWADHAGYEMVITSACDGRHGTYSRHYVGCAIDIRTWTSSGSGVQMNASRRDDLRAGLQRFLGSHFNVIDEGDHFHIGFKPTQPVKWGDLV